MPAEILDGKALAERVRRQVAIDTAAHVAQTGVVPGLTVVLVGEDPASQVYVRNKAAACKAAGMNGHVLRLPAEHVSGRITFDDRATQRRPGRSWDSGAASSSLDRLTSRWSSKRSSPRKDVDGFHPANFGLLAAGTPRFVSCTPLGIRELLLDARIETRGAHAVVLGRSRIVGRPLAFLLLQKGAGGDSTVTVCHTATRDAAHLARQADLLFVAMGQPELVTADWIKPGAVVIDVGMHKRLDGRLCGDVHFESVSRVASHITPVPGGVGPMTIAMLLKNTLQAARMSVAAGSS